MSARSHHSTIIQIRNISILLGVILLAGLGWYMVTSSDFFTNQATLSEIRSNRAPTRRFETARVQATRNTGTFSSSRNDELV